MPGHSVPTLRPQDIVVAILAGGAGTRIAAVAQGKPKALLSVAGRPFIEHLLTRLERQGFREIVLCTGYGADQIEAALGSSFGAMTLHYSRESKPLGTGGALRNALPMLTSNPVLVLNGDSLCDAPLDELLRAHERSGCPVTMTVAQVNDVARYGSVEVSDDHRVRGFIEKDKTGPGLVNAGVMLVSQELLNDIEEGKTVSLERDLLPQWIERGIAAFVTAQPLFDIGTPESLAHAGRVFTGWNDRRFVLFDRDGTLIEERHYLSDPAGVAIIGGTAAGLRLLREAGLGLLVVTNQSAIGRGFVSLETVHRIHERIQDLLREEGVELDGFYLCPHLPEDACVCRKPKSGLVLEAAASWGFDPARCFVVGDKLCDIELGANLGAVTILVQTGYGSQFPSSATLAPHYSVPDVFAAAQLIVSLLEHP